MGSEPIESAVSLEGGGGGGGRSGCPGGVLGLGDESMLAGEMIEV